MGRRSVFLDSTVYAGALAREVLSLADELRASGLWLVLHQSVVCLAPRLIRAARVPIHVTVHDDPVYASAMRSRRYLPLIPLIARDFAFTLRHATSIDVVCQNMANRYKRKYGVTSVILHRGLSAPVSASPKYDLARDGLTVGVLGNTYSYCQLPVLAEAVVRVGQFLSVPAKIIVCGIGYGDRLRREFSGRLVIDSTGHLPEPAAIERLSKCFMLYLNYPFTQWDRVLRETSFPTKLSTYLYASRPLLVHAPLGTSVADLPVDRGYVTAWTSMDPKAGAQLIADFACRPGAVDNFRTHAEGVRLRYYSYAVHRATLESMLNGLASPLRGDVDRAKC